MTGARVEASPRRLGTLVVLSGGLVLVAVALEVLGGSAANSPAPRWAEVVVPLAWPQAARVAWWLVVAAAAASFQWGIRQVGLRPQPIVVVLSIAPFVAFAAGIATGADWSTWH